MPGCHLLQAPAQIMAQGQYHKVRHKLISFLMEKSAHGWSNHETKEEAKLSFGCQYKEPKILRAKKNQVINEKKIDILDFSTTATTNKTQQWPTEKKMRGKKSK